MNEFELISYLTGDLKNNHTIIKGIGDDTAVVTYQKDKYLLLTTDSLVENIHFRLDYKINKQKLWYFLGWKALAVNVSDIYAMAGTPSECLVSLHVPVKIKPPSLKILYNGLKDCADNYKVQIVGGNLSKAVHDLIITVFLTGKVDKKKLILRETAQTRDYIYIQKGIGNAGAGLKLLARGCEKINEPVSALLQPMPGIPWEKLLKKYRINSAIDISDGLLADLEHILTGSDKGAEIYLNDIPAEKVLKDMFPKNYLEYILYGGEDYKILFTSPDKIKEKDIYPIGRIAREKGLFIIDKDKKIKINHTKGYKHF